MKLQTPESGGQGLRGLDRHTWVTLAEQQVHQLIDSSLAAPHVEIEARLWDTGWSPPDRPPGKPVSSSLTSSARRSTTWWRAGTST
jgi:hypothetical protein